MKSLKTLSLIIPLLALAGCFKPPIVGRADNGVPSQINYVDIDLRDNTAIAQPKLSRDEAGLLHVDVPIRATTDMQLYADYRVIYFDRNGAALGPATGWTAITLPGNVWQDIIVNSASPRAADFHMDLRYAK